MLKLIGINVNANTAWYFLLLMVIAGFIMIIYGGNFFVDSAIWLSKALKIPPVIIGATIVSIGTTLPEICVSIMASAAGSSATAMGNATGSPLFNQSVILGIIFIFAVLSINFKSYAPKAAILIFSVLLLSLCVIFDRTLGLVDSIILLVIFVGFMAYSIIDAKKNPMVEIEEDKPKKKQNPALMITLFFVGAAAIAFGSSFLVDGVSSFAFKVGISEQLVAITVVAIGTSLPELVTGITAIKKGNPALSMGNIIGANIINITFICGISGLILYIKNGTGASFESTKDFRDYAIAVGLLLAGLIIIFVPALLKKHTFKWQGIALVSIYTAYLGYLIINAVAL